MKTLSIGAVFLLALTLQNNLNAQNKIVTYHDLHHKRIHEVFYQNSAGNYHGSYKEYFPTGNIAKEYNYLNGEYDGRCIDYFNANGISIISEVNNWKNGKMEGLSRQYSGTTQSQGYAMFIKTETMYKNSYKLWCKNYVEGEKGRPLLVKEEFYNPYTSNLITEKGYYPAGGPSYCKSDSGRNFQYQQGTLQLEFYNRNGLKNGPYREWYPGTKQLGLSGYYCDDKLEGIYQEWDRNGKLTVSKFFDDGLDFEPLDSTTLKPDAKGNLLWLSKTGIKYAIGSIAPDGKLNGEFRKYYPDGILYKQEYYAGGKLDSVLSWYPDSLIRSRIYYATSGMIDSSIRYYDLKSPKREDRAGAYFPMELRLLYKSGKQSEGWEYCKNGRILYHYVRNERTNGWINDPSSGVCDDY